MALARLSVRGQSGQEISPETLSALSLIDLASDEDSIPFETRLHLRFLGLWNRVDAGQAFRVTLTFWQYGQDRLVLRPSLLQTTLERLLNRTIPWSWATADAHITGLANAWTVRVRQPLQTDGPRSFVAELVCSVCSDDDEEACEAVSEELWHALEQVIRHTEIVLPCFNGGFVSVAMHHPQPMNQVHRAYLRGAFRMVKLKSSDGKTSEEKRIESEVDHLPDYKLWHEPFVIGREIIAAASVVDQLMMKLRALPVHDEEIVNMFEKIQFVTGMARFLPEDQIPAVIRSFGKKEILMAAQLQLPRLTSYVTTMLENLQNLAHRVAQGMQPSGEETCRLYKALRDIYAISPSFSMVLDRMSEVAIGGAKVRAGLMLAGIGGCYTLGAGIAAAALGTASAAAGVSAGLKLANGIRTVKTRIVNDAIAREVHRAAYYVVLSYMISIGIANPLLEDQNPTRNRLMESLHCQIVLNEQSAQYTAENLMLSVSQIYEAYLKFFTVMTSKLGFKSAGGFSFRVRELPLALASSSA